MYVNFAFAALFPSPYSRVKKCGKFKTNIHLVSVDSFLYYLSSNDTENGLETTSEIVLAKEDGGAENMMDVTNSVRNNRIVLVENFPHIVLDHAIKVGKTIEGYFNS